MELIYFFIGLGLFAIVAFIWARWFYDKDENERSQTIETSGWFYDKDENERSQDTVQNKQN